MSVRRASRYRPAAMFVTYASTTLTAAAMRTIQKWLGWCSQWRSNSGRAMSSASPASGRRSTRPTGHSRAASLLGSPAIVTGYGSREPASSRRMCWPGGSRAEPTRPWIAGRYFASSPTVCGWSRSAPRRRPRARAARMERVSTWSGDRAAHPLGVGLVLNCVEPDEEGPHRSGIEHVRFSCGGVLRQDFMGHTFRRLRPCVQHLSMSDYHQQCVNTPGGPIGNELEIRSLRYFVAAAEELNFTRAAARLFVAQQALSREIKRLETQLGTTLFIRTTRRVTLTPDGERLLVRARDLVARHDAVWADVHVPAAQPTVVDLMSGGRFTATRILDLARQRASERRLPWSLHRRDRRGAREPRGRRPRRRPRTSRLARCAADADHRSGPRPARTAGGAPARRASPGPSRKRSPFAACRGSRSMACRRIRRLPNGPT